MKKLIYILIVLFSLSGCEDNLDLEPISSVSSSTFYNNKDECQLALNGIYNVIGGSDLYGKSLGITSAYGTDEALYARENQNWSFATYTFNASTKELEKVWMSLYRAINNANILLSKVGNANFSSDKDVQEIIAQARFLRAFCYYELVKRWENVPLRLEVVETLEQANNIKASSAEAVYLFIIDELEEIAPSLELPKSGSIGKATRTACWGLLARVYLSKAGYPIQHEPTESYKKVEEYCDNIINSGVHSLNPDYKNIFMQEIKGIHDFSEIIFEIQFENISSEGLNEGGAYGVATGVQTLVSKGAYCGGFSYAALSLVNLYDQDQDIRYNWNIADWKVDKKGKLQQISDIFKLYPGKFRRMDIDDEGQTIPLEPGTLSKNQTGIDFPVLRYSDVLLMKAEAINELGRTTEATPLLNQIRHRAGLADIEAETVASIDLFREELKDERSRELCFEGVRKFDLIRWGDLGRKLNDLEAQMDQAKISDSYQWLYDASRNFEDKHVVWPLPLIELEENKLIEQHSLWK
ncbi:MAG: RagB/SusD family nutrient uptake outer membrane protein [Prolixibacteraceae bacterium]|nr:RagB/SusD family nutrient uptake outer membrane protein [Prolixibacteraceae bacterium]